jgi:hypothetical protein
MENFVTGMPKQMCSRGKNLEEIDLLPRDTEGFPRSMMMETQSAIVRSPIAKLS